MFVKTQNVHYCEPSLMYDMKLPDLWFVHAEVYDRLSLM